MHFRLLVESTGDQAVVITCKFFNYAERLSFEESVHNPRFFCIFFYGAMYCCVYVFQNSIYVQNNVHLMLYNTPGSTQVLLLELERHHYVVYHHCRYH